MPTTSVTFEYEHTELAALDPRRRALCMAAREATKLAYAPYSRFRVGCAALLAGVEGFVPAANLENAAYPQCICAEAGLLARLHSQYPGVRILAIAIAVDGQGADPAGAGPCGSCRQQLFEAEARQANLPIALYLVGADNSVRVIKCCADLLPLGFSF